MVKIVKQTILKITPVVLIAIAFPLPLWTINMNAPLYGERWLTVQVAPLTGVTGDVREVNIVNHYVGLGEIDLQAIPELRLLLPLYFTLLALSVVAGLARYRRPRLHAALWLLFLAATLSLPLYLYVWLYKYTHTIKPGAPVKIDPFDPPIFGYYKIANFTIFSYLGPAFFLPLVAALILLPPRLLIRLKRSKGS